MIKDKEFIRESQKKLPDGRWPRTFRTPITAQSSKNPLDKTETACYVRANFLEGWV